MFLRNQCDAKAELKCSSADDAERGQGMPVADHSSCMEEIDWIECQRYLSHAEKLIYFEHHTYYSVFL